MDKINDTIDNDEAAEIQDRDFDDPWNNWIFEIYGELQLERETSRKEFEYEFSFENNRVTEKWWIRADGEPNESRAEFERNDETFVRERIRYSYDGSMVRSISDHWSVGIFGGAPHNTFTNIDLSTHVSPAIEYNIFPYKKDVS